eukprot:TRINITY_DN19213_c0_g1_i1.p1 TRINITY_DN19213_c0_g1~~TRINITY_DN19213_c0_g1_i1.p1  ORF type:complete len:312 (-),score=66.35 TRINITY_DN19213_c0_g1_i1:395-1330(-)
MSDYVPSNEKKKKKDLPSKEQPQLPAERADSKYQPRPQVSQSDQPPGQARPPQRRPDGAEAERSEPPPIVVPSQPPIVVPSQSPIVVPSQQGAAGPSRASNPTLSVQQLLDSPTPVNPFPIPAMAAEASPRRTVIRTEYGTIVRPEPRRGHFGLSDFGSPPPARFAPRQASPEPVQVESPSSIGRFPLSASPSAGGDAFAPTRFPSTGADSRPDADAAEERDDRKLTAEFSMPTLARFPPTQTPFGWPSQGKSRPLEGPVDRFVQEPRGFVGSLPKLDADNASKPSDEDSSLPSLADALAGFSSDVRKFST